MKELLKYILLGLVQGFTEPLPVSSSGHLVIAQDILGYNTDNINLEVILNFASLLAILFFYRKDLIKLVQNNYSFVFKKEKQYKKDFNYVLLLVVATIPAGLAGILLKDIIEDKLKNTLVVGIALLVTAFALFIVNKLGAKNTKKEITLVDSIIIGVAQAIALLPGISRSGSTLVGGLSRKIESNSVLKFSFLMYIPISLASMVLVIKDLDFNTIDIMGYSIAFLITVIATYVSLKLLYKLVKSSNLHYFSYYCVAAGIFAILLGLNVINF